MPLALRDCFVFLIREIATSVNHVHHQNFAFCDYIQNNVVGVHHNLSAAQNPSASFEEHRVFRQRPGAFSEGVTQ